MGPGPQLRFLMGAKSSKSGPKCEMHNVSMLDNNL